MSASAREIKASLVLESVVNTCANVFYNNTNQGKEVKFQGMKY